MQLCTYSDYCNIKQSENTILFLLLSQLAPVVYPRISLHNNVLQAILIGVMHEKWAAVKATTDHTERIQMWVRSRDCRERSSAMENAEKTFECPAGSLKISPPKRTMSPQDETAQATATAVAGYGVKMQQNLNFPSAQVQKMLPKWYWYRHISHILIEKYWIGIEKGLIWKIHSLPVSNEDSCRSLSDSGLLVSM